MAWTSADIPSQQHKTILITGASSGLGLQAASVLASKGAHVILTARNERKGLEALQSIRERNSEAKVELMMLDLSDFDSIHHFAAQFLRQYPTLDILINNAGVMAPQKRTQTKQGFEEQFGVNHLGHFLLTGLLLERLNQTPNARIAVQSSIVHRLAYYGGARIQFEDLQWEKKYHKDHAYGQSKLANLFFAYELDRRLKKHMRSTIVTAAHPGYTNTALQKHYGFFIANYINKIIGMPVEKGSLPILRAATDPHAKGSEFYGPTKFGQLNGYPELIESSKQSYDTQMAARLWEVSEKLCGITYAF